MLRRAADAGFEAFITADRNLEFQQNIAGSRLGVIVLQSRSIAMEDLLSLLPRLGDVLSKGIAAGQIVRLSAFEPSGD